MANINELTMKVNVRVLVNGEECETWKTRVLGAVARALGVPLIVGDAEVVR